MNNANPLLNIKDLTISFGSGDTATHAVKQANLQIQKGEMLALVGESGSGKSLTALSILKLLPSEAHYCGKVAFEGTDILTQSEAEVARLRGNRIGMIFQEPMTALNPLHPIRRQIVESYKWHHKIKGDPAQSKIAELLESVGLTHLNGRGKIYPHQLSGGERQRVMIGMPIANDPDLLIADEPTTALDVTLQQQILHLLKDLQKKRGMAILLITHDLTVVRKIADRVAVMKNGQIVEQGPVADIFANPQHEYTQKLLGATPKGVAAPIAADAPVVLSTEHLRVHFPILSPLLRRQVSVVKAIEDVSLTARVGETIGIVGESGSGKSSLGYALLRLTPSTGPIVFLGNRLDEMGKSELRKQRKEMQLVFQDPYSSLNPRMTVGEIISEGLRLHQPELSRAQVAEQVREILAQVRLKEDMIHRYPHEFSGGQRQRIAIARAMILKPKLVVLDEPTSALDMSVQGKVINLLRRLQRTYGVTYLFISHDLRVIKALAHYVIVLKRGEIVEQGTAEQIFNAPKHVYTQSLMHAAFGETL
jgi:microcin C transport system ATP-binding protein